MCVCVQLVNFAISYVQTGALCLPESQSEHAVTIGGN